VRERERERERERGREGERERERRSEREKDQSMYKLTCWGPVCEWEITLSPESIQPFSSEVPLKLRALPPSYSAHPSCCVASSWGKGKRTKRN